MTDNTQELDGILEKYGEYYHLKQLNRFSDSEMQLNFAEETDIVRAKRALLDWHNKQVKNAVATAEDNLDQYWNKELDKQVEEAMAKFHLKKGVKYDVKASDSVIVITSTNKINESKAKE